MLPLMSIVTEPSAPVPGNSASSWQFQLRHAVRTAGELLRLLDLPPSLAAEGGLAAEFPVFVTRSYLARMQPGDPHDPLLRQVLPLPAENEIDPRAATDPVGDLASSLQPGLLQKYPGRALLITTGACAIHCRYCFRRHFPYGQAPKSPDAWDPALAQLAAEPTISEVILSGGDPLTLADRQLQPLVERLAALDHLRRLRVHTRLPIVVPQRITAELVEMLRGTRLTPVVVVHANHAAELDESVRQALARLVDAGIVTLNQSVLLRGVNDTAEAQIELCERLVDWRVMPYYLHQLDRVAGGSHFEVAEEAGRRVVEQLRRRLPGYAVPRYVREIAGQESKTPLT